MAELFRVLKPGGLAAVTVPRWLPEKICWALSDEYHEVEGGHVRIYRGNELAERLNDAGFQTSGHQPRARAARAVLVAALRGRGEQGDHPATKLYHKLLVWDMMTHPEITRTAEELLNPIIGKSLVLYLRKPEAARVAA